MLWHTTGLTSVSRGSVVITNLLIGRLLPPLLNVPPPAVTSEAAGLPPQPADSLRVRRWATLSCSLTRACSVNLTSSSRAKLRQYLMPQNNIESTNDYNTYNDQLQASPVAHALLSWNHGQQHLPQRRYGWRHHGAVKNAYNHMHRRDIKHNHSYNSSNGGLLTKFFAQRGICSLLVTIRKDLK